MAIQIGIKSLRQQQLQVRTEWKRRYLLKIRGQVETFHQCFRAHHLDLLVVVGTAPERHDRERTEIECLHLEAFLGMEHELSQKLAVSIQATD